MRFVREFRRGFKTSVDNRGLAGAIVVGLVVLVNQLGNLAFGRSLMQSVFGKTWLESFAASPMPVAIALFVIFVALWWIGRLALEKEAQNAQREADARQSAITQVLEAQTNAATAVAAQIKGDLAISGIAAKAMVFSDMIRTGRDAMQRLHAQTETYATMIKSVEDGTINLRGSYVDSQLRSRLDQTTQTASQAHLVVFGETWQNHLHVPCPELTPAQDQMGVTRQQFDPNSNKQYLTAHRSALHELETIYARCDKKLSEREAELEPLRMQIVEHSRRLHGQ